MEVPCDKPFLDVPVELEMVGYLLCICVVLAIVSQFVPKAPYNSENSNIWLPSVKMVSLGSLGLFITFTIYIFTGRNDYSALGTENTMLICLTEA